mmetsp:Transcript_395/g.663  ORF Transcript_395/g.663 Transcript_395/m.663 type:complete len:261 (+) Transcript_395:224-1006(+)
MSAYSERSKEQDDNVLLSQQTRSRVQREVIRLIKKPPEGIILVVDSETGLPQNLTEIVAQIQGPEGTPYADRYFQLKLVFSSDFPSSPPRGYFLTKIYHPNVNISTGEICVNTLKKDWSPTVTISHVLEVIRCLLIIPFPESSLNDEAGKLFMESYEEYARRATLMAKIHGKSLSPPEQEGPAINCVVETATIKNSKENEGENVNLHVKQASSGGVLKQSNSADRNGNEVMSGGIKKQKPAKTATCIEKKIKKKSSLKRL